jgi:predicted aconitase
VPLAGLHPTPGAAQDRSYWSCRRLPPACFRHDELYALVGHVVGRLADNAGAGHRRAARDDVRGPAEGARRGGGVVRRSRLCHVVGVTPEAPRSTLLAVASAAPASTRPTCGPGWDELSTADGGGWARSAWARRTCRWPSSSSWRRSSPADIAPRRDLYVSTGRTCVAELEQRGWLTPIRGRRPVGRRHVHLHHADPARRAGTAVMTNSAKWAWYAPATTWA